MEKIERLVNLLDSIQDRTDLLWEDSDEPMFNGNYMDQLDENNNPTETAKLMSEIEDLANEILITNDGRPNINTMRKMRAYGYSVYAGERDGLVG